MQLAYSTVVQSEEWEKGAFKIWRSFLLQKPDSLFRWEKRGEPSELLCSLPDPLSAVIANTQCISLFAVSVSLNKFFLI